MRERSSELSIAWQPARDQHIVRVGEVIGIGGEASFDEAVEVTVQETGKAITAAARLLMERQVDALCGGAETGPSVVHHQ